MNTYIAGFGIKSVLGTNRQEIFNKLLSGSECYGYLKEREKAGYQVPFGGILPYPSNFQDVIDVINKTSIDAGFVNEMPTRVGLIVTTDSNVQYNMEAFEQYNKHKDTRGINTRYGFDSLNSHLSLRVANELGFKGLSLTISAACAGGAHAIGIAKQYLDSGALDYVFVVGHQELYAIESQITFDALRIFSKQHKVKPFDAKRDGTLPSGGTACILLTNFRTKAQYGEIVDYGFSVCNDIINPDVDSITLSMDRATKSLRRNLDEVIYVSAHATGTVVGDSVELQAIDDMFFDVPVTSTKAITGHECWMSGVSEIIYTLIQVNNLCLVKQHNYEGSELPIAKNHILTENKYLTRNSNKYILSNNFGFGGTNASILIKPWI